MLIDNPDAFKTWLTAILEPLCDADPAALAKYVYALVKKDKPVEELRDGMLDQLDVFLQHETKPFVEMLFVSLENREYLKECDEKQPSPIEPDTKEADVPNVEETNGPAEEAKEPATVSPPPSPPRQRIVRTNGANKQAARHPPTEQTLVKVLPTELLEEPIDHLPRRRDRRDSLRDKDDRRRRGRSWERRNNARGRRRVSPRPDALRHERRPTSRSPSPRGRYRNRSPPAVADRPNSRSRSRSPVAGRKRPHERVRSVREMDRDRMSRDREHRERLSRSRDRERSRSRDRSITPIENDRLSPVNFKRRCRDFDEKGYCMRGDLCQWDHGTDPLVLEDATLTRTLTLPPVVPEYNPLAPDIWGGGAPPVFPVLYGQHHPPRELVPIPRVREAGPPMGPVMPGIPPPPRHMAPMPKKMDYNRPPRPNLNQNQANCSLEVKKVPRGLNDITHLNNHFSKFGKIVNIQVCFEGDPEGALITFSNHTEANVAYKSTEAVLNNRFIKVFWHNPDNKQENVPPMNNAKPTERPASQHPSSQNKVLINKDNKKVADKPVENNVPVDKPTPITNGAKLKKENPKLCDRTKQLMEMRDRAQKLMDTQVAQLSLLIKKLEAENVSEMQKSALMDAITAAQQGIDKLKTELLAYNDIMKQKASQVKRPKTREEAQKEILDAELDMFTKQQDGQDVTELAKKITELRRQLSIQFHTNAPVRRPIHSRGGRYNSATRFVRNAAPAKVFNNQTVDHRPRALLVSGFETDETVGLVKHFAQFGEITGKEVNLAVPELIVQYKMRNQAELAMARGKNYNERTLTITWVPNNKAITPIAAIASPQVQDKPHNGLDVTENATGAQPNQETPDAVLRFDEEEEEEVEEDRSWRR